MIIDQIDIFYILGSGCVIANYGVDERERPSNSTAGSTNNAPFLSDSARPDSYSLLEEERKIRSELKSIDGCEDKEKASSTAKKATLLHSGALLGDLPSLSNDRRNSRNLNVGGTFSTSSDINRVLDYGSATSEFPAGTIGPMSPKSSSNHILDSRADGKDKNTHYASSTNGSAVKSKQKKRDAYVPPPGFPSKYLCQLSQRPMSEPVKSTYGNVFDRSVIHRWMNKQGHICPLSGTQIAIISAYLILMSHFRSSVPCPVVSHHNTSCSILHYVTPFYVLSHHIISHPALLSTISGRTILYHMLLFSPLYHIITYHILFYVQSYHIISDPALFSFMSCHVTSYHIISHHVLFNSISYNIILYHIVFCSIPSYTVSYHIISHPVLLSSVSHHTTSCHIISCHVLLYSLLCYATSHNPVLFFSMLYRITPCRIKSHYIIFCIILCHIVLHPLFFAPSHITSYNIISCTFFFMSLNIILYHIISHFVYSLYCHIILCHITFFSILFYVTPCYHHVTSCSILSCVISYRIILHPVPSSSIYFFSSVGLESNVA